MYTNILDIDILIYGWILWGDEFIFQENNVSYYIPKATKMAQWNDNTPLIDSSPDMNIKENYGLQCWRSFMLVVSNIHEIQILK